MNKQELLKVMLNELTHIPKERYSTVKFTCNDIPYVWDKSLAVYSLKGSIFTKDREFGKYFFQVEDGNGSSLTVSLNTTTLNEGKYADCSCQLKLENELYTTDGTSNLLTVEIVRIYNLYAKGKITGTITLVGSKDKQLIINGEFEEVKILV